MVFNTKVVQQTRVNFNKTLFQKTAREAADGEIVSTVINGIVETTNTAKVGDMIITGLAGEEYIINGEKFNKLYTNISGNTYVTKKDSIKAVQVTEKIHFLAPWGSEMIALPSDYIAYRSDSDAYRIEKGEFEKTYALA